MASGLPAEGSGLLGGIGSIEATVIVVLVLFAVVLGGVRCSEIDDMLGDATGNIRRGDSCDLLDLFWDRKNNNQHR